MTPPTPSNPLTPSLTRRPPGTVLRHENRVVGSYAHRPRLPGTVAPRPYLHPVRTLGGVTVTGLRPAEDPAHLGVSMAIPEVAGHDFRGGRGSLDHQGSQRHLSWLLRDPDGFVEELSWAAGGRRLLLERRTVAVRSLGTACWALDFTSALTNVTGQELALGGAGHGGGFFWRVPRRPEPAQVFSAEGEGAAAVHGRPADWLALATDEWTLVFAGATGDTRADPWWVRTGEHPGVGSALASDRPLPLAPADTVTRRIVTAITDGRSTPETAARLAAQLSDRGAAV
ncbi:MULTISPECIES: PmoA family protein [Streptomyces]|uniref:PmoA family protein n=2 Tax=Streptomyces TaxID=1883 RepID=A0ABP3LJU7_9ACTN|nr:PmoA family protein [Streptomyces sp. AgN23]AJZ85164.1 PmoA family protein [Streptomyces sp. AgN23]WTA80925.1 PmoA family protein [Streptomyces antimycoticus]WTB08634.1 PmoA family protein [Streptomyces antimycoticus]